MSKKHKWPAKAINLLVALAMVISLVAVLAPATIAQIDGNGDGYFNPDPPDNETCDPTLDPIPCDLEVFVNTYVKDEDTGVFTAVTSVESGECFYVNAAVVYKGNTSTTPIDMGGGVYEALGARIDPSSFPASMSLSSGDSEACDEDIKYFRKKGDQSIANQAMEFGQMADFWWKVCCTEAVGIPETIVVEAWDTIIGPPTENGECVGVGNTTITQIAHAADKCFEIEIIEAPGIPGAPWTDTVDPCTNFGIKAIVRNVSCDPLTTVNGTITWTGPATLVGDTPFSDPYYTIPTGGPNPNHHEWSVGDMAAGEERTVAWTLHCDDPGDVDIVIQAESGAAPGTTLDPKTTWLTDGSPTVPYTVSQTSLGGINVVITSPKDGVKQPTGDCGLENFPVSVVVSNEGDSMADNIYVYFTGTGNVTFAAPVVGPYNIPADDYVTVLFNGVPMVATCSGPGPVSITVEATSILDPLITDSMTINILQQWVIVDLVAVTQRAAALGPIAGPLEPMAGYEGKVNVCQDFQVIYAFSNYTNTPMSAVLTTINWYGPAELLDGVEVRRLQPGFPPGPWQAWTGNEGPLTVSGSGTIGDPFTWSDNLEQDICPCCCTEVRWTFKCADSSALEGDVVIWAEMTKAPTYYDTTETSPVLVYQEWKAHLISGIATFMQDDCGAMQQRFAFTPGTRFHVVLPVVNTGDADAEDVEVTFVISGRYPEDLGETFEYKTWDYLGTSGDVESFTDPFAMTSDWAGTATVNVGTIPGHGMKKVIVLLECEGEGDVSVWIPDAPVGISGIDGNTNLAIPEDNIEVQDCALTVDQVPFTVEIINPETCEIYNPGDAFAVKAMITNGSSMDLEQVDAEIYWEDHEGTPYGGAQLVGDTYPDSTPEQNIQTLIKTLGNATDTEISAGTTHEITWELECTGPGEVYIWVTATSTEPFLSATSDDDAAEVVMWPGDDPEPWPTELGNQPVNVHQTYMAEIGVGILSPGDCTNIATGEEFAVTARVNSTGGTAAENVEVEIYPWPDCTLVAGDNPFVIGTMEPYTEVVYTWTLRADHTGNMQCDWGYQNIDVEAETTTAQAGTYPDLDTAHVDIYPAAHLEVYDVVVSPATTIGVCDEFTVTYKVRNTGEADAWEVEAALSVSPDGSVRPSEGDNGYSQYIGTIPGWSSFSGEIQYVTKTFDLHCKLACESTLTITPSGNDECGWFPVEKIDNIENTANPDECADWARLPGREIPSEFIEPASVTVKQIDKGGLDLEISKTIDEDWVPEDADFIITVTNNGPIPATNVVVVDTLPVGITYVGYIATQGTYSSASGIWIVGDLGVGASATLTLQTTVDTSDPVTNTATASAGQTDSFPDNNSASVTINRTAATSASISLDAGWNLSSLELIPTGGDNLATFFDGIDTNMDVMWSYEGGVWRSWSPTWGGDLTAVSDGKGYWIKMTGSDTLIFAGVEMITEPTPQPPPTYDVAVGWNLIGFKSTTPMSAGDYLNSLEGTVSRIYGFENGMFTSVTSGDMMMPGMGYWLAVTATGTIYP